MSKRVWVLIAATLLAGCGPAPDNQFRKVQSLAADRLGQRVRWNGHTADDREVERSLDRLLARPLTVEAAVQVALLNNHKLQATFEDLGIAQADLVQAGLLKNPVLDLNIRFPDRKPFKTYLDFAAAENLLDIFLIPARKKIAAGQLVEAESTVAQEVFSLAAETASAFYAWQGAEQMEELRQTIADASSASLDASKGLREAGNITELDYLSERAQAARSRVELAAAKSDAADACERLNALMGLWGSRIGWTAPARLPELPVDGVPLDGLETLAIQQRQDLAAARQEVLTQSRIYGLTVDTRFFASAEAGIEAERETDGQWRIGPTIALPVPLFDQGQAAIARANAVVRQSQQKYAALAVETRSQVRVAQTRMLNARVTVSLYHDEILPTQEKLLEQTQLQYNGMLVGVFQLLQAKRDQIDAAARYVESLRNYWMARAELERAIGGRLPSTVPATTKSTTAQVHGE
jgi:cobalt-zinc-cadmium efflux system outer membrane protein